MCSVHYAKREDSLCQTFVDLPFSPVGHHTAAFIAVSVMFFSWVIPMLQAQRLNRACHLIW